MPELPEVEVSRMGISPHLVGQTIKTITWRAPKLRWPIPEELKQLEGQPITAIERRAKYLLLHTPAGTAVMHLGMSGSLRVLDALVTPNKHDHVDVQLTNGKVLRYNDPRRFGAWLWCAPGQSHDVLVNLGPEPLTDAFHAEQMAQRAQGKRSTVKQFIMDNRHVVGVGNIYACEALFQARIHPTKAVGTLKITQWNTLVGAIKQTLAAAIEQGGTTLKDFSQADGKPGYFKQSLAVYGRDGEPCIECGEPIQALKIGQRNTFYCDVCQIL
ncbi:bifunctional DNA-formamidopyrimidine glycosylase/DNA-(apurinic or apyrimidinic site) lyase [Vibrio sp. SM6]|uniref:Formamidopyrimidine-DNA glycosylase n=1 Tax=Vibrio agarilyticus TaxID=2726741 RepID=A0A7X8TSP8_9VIBR|nr:bifunctional DNA-formamidopyrimidine glycosylase/DNA-(apurinic or apyrimidinic site) lyase [Vibrio agarilyticus]NLS13573.1 bifunctional DNA-formamidopyrimidine glycosylase/DNA-(apurinic or apyrimidinic site) lyase [Vibrio agarilyticus]